MAARKLLFALILVLLIGAGFYLLRNKMLPDRAKRVENASKAERILYPVSHENLWGYIDPSGKIVVKPAYEFASQFNDGYAAVQLHGKWGYIDETGKMVVQPQFNQADPFSEGLARVVVDPDVSQYPGYIDPTGKWAIRTEHAEYLGAFSEGLAVISVGGNYGFIDRTGKMIIQPQYAIASPFAAGLARVGIQSDTDYTWGYIDKTGKVVIPIQFQDAEDFSEGLAAIRAGELSGYINKSGSIVITPQFEYASNFKEGLAPFVQIKFGYIDKTGKTVIHPQYDLAYPFSEGLARVTVGHETGALAGFIDTAGKMVIEPQFADAGDFHGGYAPVMVGDYTGYIDKKGKYLWYPCASCNVAANGSRSAR